MDHILLDITLDSLPPSKNARTRFNRQTRTIHTSDVARSWMEATAFAVRQGRRRAWRQGQEIAMAVTFGAGKLHTWDVDGALPCLVDAVMAGLSDSTSRPPDQWILEITARKQPAEADSTRVIVREVGDGQHADD